MDLYYQMNDCDLFIRFLIKYHPIKKLTLNLVGCLYF